MRRRAAGRADLLTTRPSAAAPAGDAPRSASSAGGARSACSSARCCSCYQDLLERLDEGVVAIAAASLLFLLPVDWARRKFTLSWNDAVNIDWGTIILSGHRAGQPALLHRSGEGHRRLARRHARVSNLLSITIIAVLISETTSNTASVAIVVPIVIPIAAAAGVDPLIPALAAVFGAS